MNRSTLILALPLTAAACQAETGFGTSTEKNSTTDAAGVMEVYPEAMVWTDLSVGNAQSEYFKISSVGDETLHIYEISIVSSADGQFAMEEPEAFDLEPGQDEEFPILCTLSAEATATGELRIRNNDADQLDFRLTLTASPAGSDTGP